MSAYYNEVDSYAAKWLRNLIAAGLIAPGDVDERSIVDVAPADLDGYTQCHFFAGIAGWSYALRLAGWPDDQPVWTGSCPCQPFSSAGQRKGHADERHLWPAFHALIAERRPATVFGEQVAGALGREWLAGVRADLEAARYAVGAADLCAAGVGAPHIRQRLFWVADAGCERRQQISRSASCYESEDGREPDGGNVAAGCSAAFGLADAGGHRRDQQCRDTGSALGARPGWDESLDRFAHGRLGAASTPGLPAPEPGRLRGTERLGNADQDGRGAAGKRLAPPKERDAQSHGRLGDASAPGLPAPEPADLCGAGRRGEGRATPEPSGAPDRRMGHPYGKREGSVSGVFPQSNSERTGGSFWSRAEWLPCLDGKARRVEPTIQPLAHSGEWGSGSRVGVLRGAGNAIVPPLAAEFVASFMEAAS